MKQRKQYIIGIIAALGMLVMVLDTKTALLGATEGIDLCLNTVIPSLFPFIVLSAVISSSMGSCFTAILHPVAALCSMPPGSEILLFIGFLGGYPVGAQSIYQSYHCGQLTKKDAQRLLGFCNNAGPAFIFGMVGNLFSSSAAVWSIWMIQIISALVVGVLLPASNDGSSVSPQVNSLSISDALRCGIKATSSICGWVVLFRILITVCARWLNWIMTPEYKSLFAGILELTNGCISLFDIEHEGLRYILCNCFLSFGGICVAMQTISVTYDLGMGMYCRGKLMQCLVSFILSVVIQQHTFAPEERFFVHPLLIIGGFLTLIFLSEKISLKKSMAFGRRLLYNKENV